MQSRSLGSVTHLGLSERFNDARDIDMMAGYTYDAHTSSTAERNIRANSMQAI